MQPNTLLLLTYFLYLALSLGMTFWVGRTLFVHGRPFLVNACRGDTALADSINHLLLVGFYLVNLGYVTLMLTARRPDDVAAAVEMLSVKIGYVALVLGLIHFLNIFLMTKFRQSAVADKFIQPNTGVTPA